MTGTARDALAVPAFRRIFVASFLSNTGRWMQFASLGVLGWEISESSAYLGALIFAQLGPLSVLSLIGGSLADTANRRVLLVGTQAWQMGWTLVLAVLVIDDTISRGGLLLLVFVMGLGQGLYAPAFTSVLPSFSGEDNLGAAVALNSMQINGARVLGPALGGWLTSVVGFAEVFAITAALYVAVISALFLTWIPPSTSIPRNFSERVLGGFRAARRAPHVGGPIAMMALFSLLCLPFVGQLPAIAELNLGIDPQSTAYGWFYATFGLGALAGTALVATVLLPVARALVARSTLVAFGASLAWLAALETVVYGYAAIFLVGLFYFTLPTVLATHWQSQVDGTLRGRIAALWVLSFGGMVPIANIIAGRVIEATSLRGVMLFGSLAAIGLAVSFPLPSGPVIDESILDG